MNRCPRCAGAVSLAHEEPDGLLKCPRCRRVFDRDPNRYAWVFWGPVAVLTVMGLVKTISGPIQSVDASEGWHLRHDR